MKAMRYGHKWRESEPMPILRAKSPDILRLTSLKASVEYGNDKLPEPSLAQSQPRGCRGRDEAVKVLLKPEYFRLTHHCSGLFHSLFHIVPLLPPLLPSYSLLWSSIFRELTHSFIFCVEYLCISFILCVPLVKTQCPSGNWFPSQDRGKGGRKTSKPRAEITENAVKWPIIFTENAVFVNLNCLRRSEHGHRPDFPANVSIKVITALST